MIASEETEPGIGWYYTNWLTNLSKNTSMPTLEIGKMIVDDFVDTCAQKLKGQSATLSVVDLAEVEAAVPKALANFSADTCKMIENKEYANVSNARNGAREFGSSSRIDQVDLVHLAKNMKTPEGDALVKTLLSAVKYNRTSSNMTNSYGLSIYFPYRKASMADTAVNTYEQIGMDGRSLDQAAMVEYFAENFFDGSLLQWSEGAISLPEKQWELVQTLHANMFYDDGAGYIDLGLDNVYEFDEEGNLLLPEEYIWIAVNEQPVAYYHESTVDDGENIASQVIFR